MTGRIMRETLGIRLKSFIEINYRTHFKFAEVTDINPNIISRYINEKSLPSVDILLKMKQAGISINWLLDGTGNKYSDTPKGRFFFQHDANSATSISKPFDRIKTWIVQNFESIERFALQFNLDCPTLMEIFNENAILDPKLFTYLKDAGCNLYWIVYGIDEPESSGSNSANAPSDLKTEKTKIKNPIKKNQSTSNQELNTNFSTISSAL